MFRFSSVRWGRWCWRGRQWGPGPGGGGSPPVRSPSCWETSTATSHIVILPEVSALDVIVTSLIGTEQSRTCRSRRWREQVARIHSELRDCQHHLELDLITQRGTLIGLHLLSPSKLLTLELHRRWISNGFICRKILSQLSMMCRDSSELTISITSTTTSFFGVHYQYNLLFFISSCVVCLNLFHLFIFFLFLFVKYFFSFDT